MVEKYSWSFYPKIIFSIYFHLKALNKDIYNVNKLFS